MSASSLAILQTGLVTSVGLSAPASCAAFRGKLTNPSATRFIDSDGEWITAHQVEMDGPRQGIEKLAMMAALAIEEALAGTDRGSWPSMPLLLCVAENERPGRMAGLEDRLFSRIEELLGARFAETSAVIAHGRVAVAVALSRARVLLSQQGVAQAVIAATDSLVTWPTLGHYERADRLLTPSNSNGFMPGEAAGALLVGASTGGAGELVCTGIGFGREAAHIDSEEPLRADGLTSAIKAALAECSLQMHDFDFRITDTSGEQFYFKEAALALSRTMRGRKEIFDIWHPAECIGEVGSASGAVIVAAAHAACAKAYSLGPNVLAHMSNDAGQRAALALQYRVAA